MTQQNKLTSVKVDKETFLQFKQEAIKENFSFKKLVDKALYLYLTDTQFRQRIQEKI